MSAEQDIIDVAKYLRNVRPLDPDEITEYVSEPAHPGYIRQTLREHAFELEIVERSDGTFIPIQNEPISVPFQGVSKFPEKWASIFEEYLTETYGREWWHGTTGDNLRNHIDNLKVAYFGGELVEYSIDVANSYALYHLPDYYATIQYVIDELVTHGLITQKLTIADIGAGVGGPLLGIHDYLPSETLVSYDAIEPSSASTILERFTKETNSNFSVHIHTQTAQQFQPNQTYDLLCFINVLSELTNPVEVVEKYLDHLKSDGTLIAIEPADKQTAISLRSIERRILEDRDEITVFGPTLRLWPDSKPSDKGWSFTRKPSLERPSFQEKLDTGVSQNNTIRPDAGDGRYVNTDVQYSYVLVRLDGVRKYDFEPDPSQVEKMANSAKFVTERMNFVGIKLSPNIGSTNPVFKISDGSETVDHYAVVVKKTALNESLLFVEYGTILQFENVLVLWNAEEQGYNLVVDAESSVEPVQ